MPDTPPTPSLPAGHRLADRYRVVESVGRGAMAEVYRVHDEELDEEIALKVLSGGLAGSTEMIEQFKKEIRLARRIVHPNVCRTYDFGRADDLTFVTMELIEGEPLGSLVRDGRCGDLARRLDIFRDVLLGLRAAHHLGIVHRDIKPLNVMVTNDGRTLLMDFGIAQEAKSTGVTAGGKVVGTPGYISPERIRGRDVDQRGDIYSLGVLLFEMITGRLPFRGDVKTVVQHHLDTPAPRVREFDSTIPEAIERAILRMMEKSPENRYGNVDQVLEDLNDIRLGVAGRIVLLVQDHPAYRELLKSFLTALGLVVRTAGDGEAAIEQMLKERPDALVLDTELPKIDGLRVTEVVRQFRHGADLPVWLTSRTSGSGYDAYARQLGVRGFLRRPFPIRPFARQLRDALEEGTS